MFKLFKRKPKEIVQETVEDKQTFSFNGCTFTLIFGHDDKNVKVVCDWPQPTSQEHLMTIANDYSKLVINFFREEMLKYIIPSIVNQGIRTNSQPLVQTMLGMMENLLLEKKKKEKEVKNSPVIDPTQTFKVRG